MRYLIWLVLGLMSCGSYYGAAYNLNLDQVIIRNGADIDTGYAASPGDTAWLMSYSDSLIDTKWGADYKFIYFQLENKTNYPASIIWQDFIFVDENGLSHNVLRGGQSFADCQAPHSPSAIAPKGKLLEKLAPCNKIVNTRSGWIQYPLFDNPNQKIFIGKTISTYVPVEISGLRRDYSFRFFVRDLPPKSK